MANKDNNNQVKLTQKLQLAEKHIESIIIVFHVFKKLSRDMEDIKIHLLKMKTTVCEMENTLNRLKIS